VPNSHQPHLTIWGRANSVNVQKVLWCLCELDLAYQRIDAGMAFGRPASPREIGNAVAFLASSASGYTTGTVLTINGG